MSTPGLLVALGAAGFEPSVVAGLPADAVRVVRRCVDVPDLVAAASSNLGVVALVSAQLGGLDVDVVDRLAREGVAVVGVVAGDGSADEAVLRRIGIERIAAADDVATLVELVTCAAQASDVGVTGEPAAAAVPGLADPPGPGRPPGTVIAVWGPAGAPGRSTVALGLAAAIAELRVSALVVDADVYGGSLAQAAGVLDEASGLLGATRAANLGQLDVQALAGHCRLLNPRLRVLTGLPRADRWIEAGPALVRNVLDLARRLAAVTVVDCGFSLEHDEELSYDTAAPRRNGATVEVLERADTILVVGAADPVGLGRLIRGIHELAAVVPNAQPVVVVNKVRQANGWVRTDLEAALRRTTAVTEFAWLPLDTTACDKALLRGKTLPEAAPSSRLARALLDLATALTGVRVDHRRGRPRRQVWKSSQRPVRV